MSLWVIRLLIVIGGVLLPYVAAMIGGSTALLNAKPDAIIVFGAFNSICRGGVLLATVGYRNPAATIFPVVIGLALPTYFYLNFGSKSTSPFGIIFMPIENLVLVFIGWLAGRYVDKRSNDE